MVNKLHYARGKKTAW